MEKWPKMLPTEGSQFWLYALGALTQIFAHNQSLCEFTDMNTLMLKDTGCIPRTGTGEWITRNLCECSSDARYFQSYSNLSLWRSVRNFTRQIFSSTAFCVVFLVCLCIFNLKYTSYLILSTGDWLAYCEARCPKISPKPGHFVHQVCHPLQWTEVKLSLSCGFSNFKCSILTSL